MLQVIVFFIFKLLQKIKAMNKFSKSETCQAGV